MKGLMVRDLLALKQQFRFLAVCAVLAVLYLVLGMSEFAVGFLPFFLVLIYTKMLITDLSSKNCRFFFTLPFTRKEYVTEKYVFCSLLPALVLLVCSVLAVVAGQMSWQAAGQAVLTIVPGLLVCESISMPLLIKFKEKGSLIMAVCACLVCVLAALSMEGPLYGLWQDMAAAVTGISWKVGMIVWWIGSLVITLFSWMISCRIVSKMDL